jgi:hypothetical protein
MHPVRRRVLLLRAALVVASLACAARSARAQAPARQPSQPVSTTTEYSPYEREAIKNALAGLHLELDTAPEGKTIERIETVRLEVFEKRDPVPDTLGLRTFANSLHVTTRDFVVRREMLLGEGDRYVQVIVDEMARNMRSRMTQVSVVIIVPVKGGSPDKVGLLVITKDIWSLRLSFDLGITPGGLENLLIVPQETNLLGFQHTLQTRFQYQPESYTFGAGYSVPRFGRTWLGASAGANVILNRRSGEPEGSSASVSMGQGLYSTRTEWAYSASASAATGVARRYVNAQVAGFDARATRDVKDNIPFQYKSRSLSASAGVTRSFGWAVKNNFGLTLNAASSSYDTFDLSRYDPAAVREFRARALPTGEDRIYPALSWSTFTTNFLRTLDINTLALQEDYRIGHDVALSVYPVTTALGSTRDLVGFSGRAGYSVALGDGLFGASVSSFMEVQTSTKVNPAGVGEITDASFGASLGAVTPRFGVGRLVMNSSFQNRWRNYLNARTFTGGDDRLRGYPSNFFFGKDTVFFNLEFRSRPVEILKAQLGGVLFYDVGDASTRFFCFTDGSDRGGSGLGCRGFDPKQSLGFGVRALFPQVNRAVFRFDLAFPLKRGPFPETGITTVVDPVGFYFAFEQAFSP